MNIDRLRGNPRAGHLAIGTGLIALGLVFGLRSLFPGSALGALRPGPLLLALLAAGSFLGRGWRSFSGHLLLCGALALQLKAGGHQDLLVRWWPLALVWLGAAKLAGALRCRHNGARDLDVAGRCS